MKNKDKSTKRSKLTKEDLSVIARIIGGCSSLSTSIKEDGVWRSANLFEVTDPYHRIYAT